jgi:hypothetical protein
MIANQRQFGDSSSKRCITPTATAVTDIEPYADPIKTATVGTDNAADDYPTETAATANEMASGLLNWYTHLQARAVGEVPIECFAAEAAKSKWCVHQ